MLQHRGPVRGDAARASRSPAPGPTTSRLPEGVDDRGRHGVPGADGVGHRRRRMPAPPPPGLGEPAQPVPAHASPPPHRHRPRSGGSRPPRGAPPRPQQLEVLVAGLDHVGQARPSPRPGRRPRRRCPVIAGRALTSKTVSARRPRRLDHPRPRRRHPGSSAAPIEPKTTTTGSTSAGSGPAGRPATRCRTRSVAAPDSASVATAVAVRSSTSGSLPRRTPLSLEVLGQQPAVLVVRVGASRTAPGAPAGPAPRPRWPRCRPAWSRTVPSRPCTTSTSASPTTRATCSMTGWSTTLDAT